MIFEQLLPLRFENLYNMGMYTAVIEMPKGDDRRRHVSYEKTGMVDLGPIKDIIPVNDGIMPIHYGYVEGTKNAVEGDEVDVLIFSQKPLRSEERVEIYPIGLLRRADGDDKIIAVDSKNSPTKTWEDIPQKERELILSYFGYHHKIVSIEDGKSAELYLRKTEV